MPDINAGDAQLAQGQILSIAQQTALFALLGTSYGGNGSSTFDLPELAGTVMVGAGSIPTPNVGVQNGQDSVTLNSANMPTSVGGNDLPFNIDQPSVGVSYIINAGGNGTGVDVPGIVVPFLGDFAPDGYLLADGQTLNISDYPTLFATIGTTYGGNGTTTFMLPNLEGITVIGTGSSITWEILTSERSSVRIQRPSRTIIYLFRQASNSPS